MQATYVFLVVVSLCPAFGRRLFGGTFPGLPLGKTDVVSVPVCCPSLGFFGFSIAALTVILCGAKSWTSLAPIWTSLAPIWTKG